jgi:hypothetical protein
MYLSLINELLWNLWVQMYFYVIFQILFQFHVVQFTAPLVAGEPKTGRAIPAQLPSRGTALLSGCPVPRSFGSLPSETTRWTEERGRTQEESSAAAWHRGDEVSGHSFLADGGVFLWTGWTLSKPSHRIPRRGLPNGREKRPGIGRQVGRTPPVSGWIPAGFVVPKGAWMWKMF